MTSMSIEEEFTRARKRAQARKRSVTVDEAVTSWLSGCSLAPTTIARYSELHRLYLSPAIGSKRLDALTMPDVVAVRMVLSARLGASGMNQSRAVLVGAVKHARERFSYDGDDPSRWWLSARVPPRKNRDVLSPEQVEELMRHALSLRDSALYATMAYGCLRLSECRALLYGHLDFDGKKILVRDGYTDEGGDGPTKGRNVRTMPMAPQLENVLRRHLRQRVGWEHGDRVFTEISGAVLDEDSARRRLAAAAKKAGLGHITPHLLRHSGATMLAREFSVPELSAMLGHRSWQTTSLYVHVKPREEDAERIGKLIGGDS